MGIVPPCKKSRRESIVIIQKPCTEATTSRKHNQPRPSKPRNSGCPLRPPRLSYQCGGEQRAGARRGFRHQRDGPPSGVQLPPPPRFFLLGAAPTCHAFKNRHLGCRGSSRLVRART